MIEKKYAKHCIEYSLFYEKKMEILFSKYDMPLQVIGGLIKICYQFQLTVYMMI